MSLSSALSRIPLFKCTTFSLYSCQGEAQLVWFQFLAITKSTSVSIVDRSNVHMVWLPILWLYAQEWLGCVLLQFDNQHFEKWPPIFPKWLTSLNQQRNSDPLTAYHLQHKLSLMVLILPFWPINDDILDEVWFSFPWMLWIWSRPSFAFWTLETILFRILCLALCPMFSHISRYST